MEGQYIESIESVAILYVYIENAWENKLSQNRFSNVRVHTVIVDELCTLAFRFNKMLNSKNGPECLTKAFFVGK